MVLIKQPLLLLPASPFAATLMFLGCSVSLAFSHLFYAGNNTVVLLEPTAVSVILALMVFTCSALMLVSGISTIPLPSCARDCIKRYQPPN